MNIIMENQLPTEKQQTQAEKKAWITPEMEEINVNGLNVTNANEMSAGTIS